MPPDAERRPADDAGAALKSTTKYDGNSLQLAAEIPPASSPLRRTLDSAAESQGMSAKDLTVLAPQNDPFRLDTPARHRDGEWLGMQVREMVGDRKVHLRGLHYMMVGRPKPDGTPYTNTDPDWLWLSCDAGKAARWLDYVPFDQITDRRNSAPTVRIFQRPDPTPYLSVGLDVEIPDEDDLIPEVGALDFTGVQPFKIVLFGEKSSLESVLAPFAEQYEADLYLPTGEISDTMLHQMASVGAADGRPMVVLTFSDCDPAGWQMPVSIARKLQAFKASMFPGLEFQVHRVSLTPDQVRLYALPSTPLKDTEKRADKWTQAMGVQQTEIDALASLQPRLLEQIAADAVAPFYDATLSERVWVAQREWVDRAQAAVDEQMDGERLARLRADAAVKLATMREQIDELNNSLQIDLDDFEIPMPIVPIAQIDGGAEHGTPLVDSQWSFTEQCRHLIDSKAYRNGDGVR